jgi:AcrR family transcriptional regulator
MKTPSQEAYERILGAAEKLFAEQGYDGTTLRQVTGKAGVNLAAVNYYHGDKESLYAEVVRRRLHPVNHRRLAALAEAEREAGGAPVALERLIDCLARPLFELCASEEGGRFGARLVGRCLVEPLPFMEKFLAEELQPVLARFAQAIRRHFPALSPEEFLWRFSFVVGAMQHSVATLHQMKALTRGICRDHDHAGAVRCFGQFASQTLAAGSGPMPPVAENT